ncbi:hypothetical protein [Phycicoccus sp. Root101]|uniref:hypothetical protein n=1 Tax=Phycicoccus sp. Root101 TaxID=1736421 RepID=UPI0012FBF6A6|nr:hypothetical protein [Phycicoccus sp. Root101]
MHRTSIDARIRIALTQLIVDEWRLVSSTERDRAGTANEVAVAFALGWHLKPLVDRRWDVDCEYNRATDAAGDSDVKRRSGGNRVYPDLLIHRRRERGPENNLLVLELKTNSSSQTHRGGSQATVADVVELNGYQHGVFLDLKISGQSMDPHWAWYQPAQGVVAGTWSARRRIYSAQSRDALVARAKAEADMRY